MITYPKETVTKRKTVLYDTFYSVDFAKASANLKPYYSPNALNMVRDEYGKVRRRMGYHKAFSNQFDGKIYGMARYGGNLIVHAGTTLYKVVDSASPIVVTTLYSDMKAHVSQFFQAQGNLYLIDSKNFLCFDGSNCKKVSGKIPRIIISGTPLGGGTQFEQINLIQDKWEQSFLGDATSLVYQLAFGDLDSNAVVVKKAKLQGNVVTWETLVENTHFTVNRTLGTIAFTTAPGEPVVAQEDNIIVTASKDRSEQRSRIFSCSIGKVFGINGYENQLFLSGNPSCKNQVFWSSIHDFTYFGDLQYALLGQDDSAVMAFNTRNTQLVVHKDTASSKSYLCSVFSEPINELQTPQIKVEKVISGAGCVCSYASAQFGEPLFLTQLGLQTITQRDLSDYEIETLRGDRINRKLLSEPNLSGAVACVYKYFYLIAINSNVYVLDRLNPVGESNTLSNATQYNGFFWNHIPASCLFVDGEELYFGTNDGYIMQFYRDESLSSSYSDDGESYDWCWELPEYVGELFYSNKAIKYIALRAKAYARTSVIIDVQLNGLWYEVLRDNLSFGFLNLNDLDLDKLNLSTDSTPKKSTEKYNERKLDKFAFRIRGNTANEPFGLYSFAFEVKEKGKHKG